MTDNDQFFEDVARKCAMEIAQAKKSGDVYRQAGVIEALARLLGRSAAMITNGDAKAIDKFLAGSENYAAEEAAEFSQICKLAKVAREVKPQ